MAKTVDFPVVFYARTAAHTGHTPEITCNEASYGGFELDNGSMAMAYWYPANIMTTEYEGSVTLEIAVAGKYPEKYTEISLVDPMDGTVYAIPESMTESDGKGGYIFNNLPIRDYPLFLVFGEIN